MVGVQVRRDQALYATRRGLSQRRACTLLSISRTSLSYRHKMPIKDAEVITKMKSLSGVYPRYGSRRIRVFLKREGIILGKEKCARLWAKAGLQVPKKRCRKRAGSTLRPLAPTKENSVWSYDFVYDSCANGQKIKCLTVTDEYTRECLAIDVNKAVRSSRVIDILSALMNWVQSEGLTLALIEPGKPWQNGSNESFNGKFRDECLSMEWFRNRIEAKIVIEDWRKHYNQVRPHSSLNYQTPSEFKRSLGKELTTGADFSM